MLFAFLLGDLVGIFYNWNATSYGIFSLVVTLAITAYGYYRSYHTQITKVEVPIAGLQQPIHAVHLTDTHIGHFRINGFLDKLIAQTNALNPDVIFLTGDYLDSKYALKEAYFEPLRKLNAPVYFVDGNHDHSTDNDQIITYMKQVGVNVLMNEKTMFQNIQIVGLSYMQADRWSFDMHAS
jgi:predicted MPP superfamily phosphohydrolase